MAQRLSAKLLVCAVLILLSCHYCHSLSSSLSKLDHVTDRSALLSFKSMVTNDPSESLTSWNDSVHFCHWLGVKCGHRHPDRVVSLNLISLSLFGSLSPSIANLTFLRTMDLSDNQFSGPVPPEIGHLFRLRHLNLSVNLLGGGIPTSLSLCLTLQVVDLHSNKLQGVIQPFLTNLSFLSVLSMGYNQLSGCIPETIGNLYFLSVLDFSANQLTGDIPPSLGKLSKLTQLDLSNNHLSGEIPVSLWNLSSLSHLSLAFNNLSGLLPSNVGLTLPRLERIYLYNNQFGGPIPITLSNASWLEIIDFSNNWLIGTIPPSLGSLQNLKCLNLVNNLLVVREPDGWSFLTALTNCTNLEKLQLDFNNLGNVLPNSIANFSTKLQRLTMSGNGISGNISPDVGNLLSLTTLDMGQNLLKGFIPASIGTLHNLHVLHLDTNKLSGLIPSTLGNLTQLNSLRLQHNDLSGVVPPNLGNCQHLVLLDLSFNKLSGGIPKQILTISTLSIYMGLAQNSLTGSIPPEVGRLKNLGKFDVSWNKLSGELPENLSECQELEEVYLGGNLFHGNVSSLRALRGMQELDISQNNLSGHIPDFLQDFSFLYYLNLSFNNFDGEVPQSGVFANTSAFSFLGNKKLCGGNPKLQLPPCSFDQYSTGKSHHRFAMVASIVSVAILVLCLFLLFWSQKPKGQDMEIEMILRVREHPKFSYQKLKIMTDGFSMDNLIGVGSFGTVYKASVGKAFERPFTQFVAVKVLNLQQRGASKSFITECNALKNINQRNLVRIFSTCSGVDSMGNDFKAIVLEYVANGNLDNWLHPIGNEQHEPKKLGLIQRVNIAIDVASALNYLHNIGDRVIIHRDIKPSNIFLDTDMTAIVGDFGLSMGPSDALVKSSLHSMVTTIAFRGTIGYIAPEYGMANRASTEGDVYSYGVLLLEIFTGKRPTDDTVIECLSLHNYVEMAFPDRILDVVDTHLLSSEFSSFTDIHGDGDDRRSINERALKCISSFIEYGLLCSNELPARRPEIKSIMQHLRDIRSEFLYSGN